MPTLVYFSPHTLLVGARERGCFSCDYFRGQWSGGHVVCERFERERVIGDARIGCAYWMRAVGADDWGLTGRLSDVARTFGHR